MHKIDLANAAERQLCLKRQIWRYHRSSFPALSLCFFSFILVCCLRRRVLLKKRIQPIVLPSIQPTPSQWCDRSQHLITVCTSNNQHFNWLFNWLIIYSLMNRGDSLAAGLCGSGSTERPDDIGTGQHCSDRRSFHHFCHHRLLLRDPRLLQLLWVHLQFAT